MTENLKKFNDKIMALGLHLELIQTEDVQIFVDKKLVKEFPHAQMIKSVITPDCVRLFLKQNSKLKVAEIDEDGKINTFIQD